MEIELEPTAAGPAPLPPPARPLRAARRAVALLFFVDGAVFASWVSRIPAVETSHGMSHGELGLALLGIALGALVAMPLAGWFCARFGSARLCRLATLLYCAAIPWLALAPNVPVLMLCLFVFGATFGALDVAINAQAVVVEERYRRPIMSSFHALYSAGGLAGAMIGAVITGAGIGLFPHFAATAVLLGSSCAILAFPRLLGGDAEEKSLPSDRGREKRGFSWPSRALLGLGVIAFCVMMGEGAMADWSALFLSRVAGAGEGLAAGGFAAFSIAMAGGRFFGDQLAMRFGSVNLVRYSGALAAAGLALALILKQPVASLAGFAAVGAGFATVVPQVFSAAGRVSEKAAGPALATVTTLGYLGFLIGPPLIGFFAQFFGLRIALGIIVVASLLLIALAGGLRGKGATAPREEQRRREAMLKGPLEELT